MGCRFVLSTSKQSTCGKREIRTSKAVTTFKIKTKYMWVIQKRLNGDYYYLQSGGVWGGNVKKAIQYGTRRAAREDRSFRKLKLAEVVRKEVKEETYEEKFMPSQKFGKDQANGWGSFH